MRLSELPQGHMYHESEELPNAALYRVEPAGDADVGTGDGPEHHRRLGARVRMSAYLYSIGTIIISTIYIRMYISATS